MFARADKKAKEVKSVRDQKSELEIEKSKKSAVVSQDTRKVNFLQM
jgi:hypothetical protein